MFVRRIFKIITGSGTTRSCSWEGSETSLWEGIRLVYGWDETNLKVGFPGFSGQMRNSGAVSYTHLDVYKRQKSRPTISVTF